MRKFTRRTVLAAVGAAAALHVPALRAAPADCRHPRAAAYDFFDAPEARFIEAACERLIPADEAGPGALGAEVPRYLDRQLAGAWGAGESLYRSGRWQPGTPAAGLCLRFAPAHLFRAALSAICGMPFHAWPAADQDSFLRHLAAGGTTLAGVPSAVFFQMLLGMTVEGFFSHPVHGATRDRVAWPMNGFPGALAGGSSARQQAMIRIESTRRGERS